MILIGTVRQLCASSRCCEGRQSVKASKGDVRSTLAGLSAASNSLGLRVFDAVASKPAAGFSCLGTVREVLSVEMAGAAFAPSLRTSAHAGEFVDSLSIRVVFRSVQVGLVLVSV